MAVRFVVTTSDLAESTFGNPVEFSYSANAYDVVDKLSVTFLPPSTKATYIYLRVYLDEFQIFKGMVDRQTDILGSGGNYLMLECSGMIAQLVQNQVQPKMLTNYSSNQLFTDYAAPYGVTGNDLPYVMTIPKLEIGVGMTAWNVIDVFCRQAYAYLPKITQEGRLTTLLHSNNQYTIGNDTTQAAHRYSDIRVSDIRDQMISRVHIKSSGGEYDYSETIDNSFTTKYKIKRERYYKPPKAWEAMPDSGAYEILRNSSIRSLEVQVVLPDLVRMFPGDMIVFKDPFFARKNYYIGDITLTANQQGYTTKLKLWDSMRS